MSVIKRVIDSNVLPLLVGKEYFCVNYGSNEVAITYSGSKVLIGELFEVLPACMQAMSFSITSTHGNSERFIVFRFGNPVKV